MKFNRTHLFIAFSTLALVIVLLIQVNWILNSARMKEALFNEKANMVLTRTAESLSSNQEAIQNLKLHAGKNEVGAVDSVLNHYMNLYNFHLDYHFEITPLPTATNSTQWNNYDPLSGAGVSGSRSSAQPGCYTACVNDNKGEAVELKLVLPEKNQFILAEMGVPFITSVLLIIVVLILSWRTMLSLQKEKQLSEHTTDFLNNMTHEFKTPLTNIALAGKLLVRDSNIGQEEKIKHYAGIIIDENEKLSQQVEQVLSMTALERGEIPLSKTETDFHFIINDALKRIRLQAENLKANISYHPDAEHFVVNGDTIHLTNSLCNLLDNALKYSSGIPVIDIQTTNAGSLLVCQIRDNGIGIESEHHKSIFRKFFRVPTGNIHNVKGFGIGLAYIKTIVELHGGTISVESEPGKGTTFTLTLPYVG